MRLLLPLLIIIGVVVIVALRLRSRPGLRAPRREAQGEHRPIEPDQLADPGHAEDAPLRPDGRPVPGSRPARNDGDTDGP